MLRGGGSRTKRRGTTADRTVYRLGVDLTILRKAYSRGESGGSDVALTRWVRLSRMFTGLVQAMGVVDRISPSAEGARLAIDFGGWPLGPDLGASISVSGFHVKNQSSSARRCWPFLFCAAALSLLFATSAPTLFASSDAFILC